MALNLDRYNDRVAGWTAEALLDFKVVGALRGIVHRADSPSKSISLNKFRSRLRQQDGAVNKISITFPRTLIYTHKGAGKGRGGIKGSRWVDKYGAAHTTNPKSFGKMGTGGRVAKPFINEVLNRETGMDKLATIAATELGDAIVGTLFIKK